MDRFDAMQAFAAVADLGSFAEAARRLRLSPAAVTRAVAQVERRLGQTLLHRTTRSVKLTERGAAYLQDCRQILAEVAAAERRAASEGAAPRGTLAVAAPLMFGRLHVLPVIARLLREHPALAVRLTLADRMIRLVEEGFDVAVRIGELADSALVALKVGEVRRVLAASPAYLAAHGTPASPDELRGHDLISFEGPDAVNEWQFGEAEQAKVRIEPRLAVNSADAAIAAAEDGLGITRTLLYQVDAAVRAGRLRLLLEAFGPPARPVQIVHPARRLGSANVAAFIRAARAHFATLPVLGRGDG